MTAEQRQLHEHYMRRCLDLASRAIGNTGSNPMVGCVIVESGKIIGEGFHRAFREAHAEVNAIESVKNRKLLKSSTLYVNLEPCSHYGKTPPCADLIIKSGIPHVVIGMKDPNSLVGGKGIERMKKAACIVESGLLEEECMFLNRRFISYHEKRRPYIILKWARSADGFIDIDRTGKEKRGPNWISGPRERMLVHKWRSQEQAILVGTNTAAIDDPTLNVRYWPGRSPIRMVIDRDLRLNKDLKIFDGSVPTVVFNNTETREEANTRYFKLKDRGNPWPSVLDYMYEQELISLFVEGGAAIINSLLEYGLWDEARIFTSRHALGSGIKAPGPIKLKTVDFNTATTDLSIIYNRY